MSSDVYFPFRYCVILPVCDVVCVCECVYASVCMRVCVSKQHQIIKHFGPTGRRVCTWYASVYAILLPSSSSDLSVLHMSIQSVT